MTTLTAAMPARPATLAAGDAMPVEAFGPVTRTDFVRYQGASGDMNPIHHDEVFARAAGFPSPFSVGMWQASLLARFLSSAIPCGTRPACPTCRAC